MNTTSNTKDPRCPVCGNAVIGGGVQGHEGTYHIACTQPPLRIDWPENPVHPSAPYAPYIPYMPWTVNR